MILKISDSQIYDCVIDLDLTNPCRSIKDISTAFAIYQDKQPKTLFSVVKARKSPYFNQVQHNEINGKIQLSSKVAALSNSIRGIYNFLPKLCRQDCPEVFDLNCSIYIYNALSTTRISRRKI